MVTQGLSPLIEKRLRRLVADHKTQLGSMQYALNSAQGAVKSAQAQLETVEARRGQAIEQFEKKVEALIGMANDPTVLVRNYGVNLVYHSARQPCGKANPKYAVEMPWGEAKAYGYHACSFCGWHADRDAEEVHKEDLAS